MCNIIFNYIFKSFAIDRQEGQRKIFELSLKKPKREALSHIPHSPSPSPPSPLPTMKKTNVYFPQNITGSRFYSRKSWFFMISVRKTLRHSAVCVIQMDPPKAQANITPKHCLIVPEQPGDITCENKNREMLERAAFPAPWSPSLCQYQRKALSYRQITHLHCCYNSLILNW